MTKGTKIKIYTDGACSGNPGIGGWGAILIYGNKEKEISGGNPETTNNQMELTAVIEALKILKKDCQIELYTDSKYVMDGITKWIHNWQKNNWKTAAKKPVKNKELWQDLVKETSKHEINWNWIKGHNGDKYNEIADTLAVSEVEKLK
ncbi:MAG: ribonuclease HI [Alphaproteobacteria bacterium]|jgi:ribonuclease HI|nr:ribonuclease HI [Alphaproteobacteria bacterium]